MAVTTSSAFIAAHDATGSTQSLARRAAVAALYVIVYVLLESISYVRPLFQLGITPWNPQAGVTLAFLILFGWRWLPITIAAALLGEMLVHPAPAGWVVRLGAAIWIGLAYGALAAVSRHWRLADVIRTSRDAARLASLVAGGTLIVAMGYVALFVGADALPWADATRATARYWIGEMNGVIPLTPLLLHASDWRQHLREASRHRWQVLAQLAAIALVLCSILLLPAEDQLRFFYLLFVPVIWIALRWSWPGAMLSLLVIQLGLLIAAQTNLSTARYIDLQFLMLTLSLTGLLLGAVVFERAGVLQRVAIREAEQRALLAMAPDAVLAVGHAGDIRLANAAALRLFGERVERSPSVGIDEILPGLDMNAPENRTTLEGRRGDGVHFPAEVAWACLDQPSSQSHLVIVRDVTDRRRAEQQLREREAALARAMRFAVAGELASALAHELNQPITALVSYLHASAILSRQSAADDDRLQTTLDKAGQEAIRAANVLRRLRNFYQGGALKRERMHIPTICDGVASAFQDRLRRTGATLAVKVDPAIPAIEGDSTQLEIVLHNLIANALDAVTHPAAVSRQIELIASCSEGAVTLRVEDSGPGIASDLAKTLFEPFVTSKADGMGLGLAISRSLLRARGGDLGFASRGVLGGASFAVRLPIEIPATTSVV